MHQEQQDSAVPWVSRVHQELKVFKVALGLMARLVKLVQMVVPVQPENQVALEP